MINRTDIQNKISVVICTYNNADSLDITLGQLKKQECKTKIGFECIIVDNNSTDHTKFVIEKHCRGTHFFVNVFEPVQGLSHARNSGVQMAKGQFVLFTDDDADLPDNWIEEYTKIINVWNPDCCYSKIAVIWDKPEPWWYCDEYRPFFVGLEYGNCIMQINDINHEFFGKNFCIRKSDLDKLGGFDIRLGRNGNRMVAGEETIIYRKLIARGKKVVYFPNAGVGHRLKEKEYTEEHISKLFVDGAYSAYHIANQFAIKKLFNRPLGILVEAIKIVLSSIGYLAYYKLMNRKVSVFYYNLLIKRYVKILELWFQRPN